MKFTSQYTRVALSPEEKLQDLFSRSKEAPRSLTQREDSRRLIFPHFKKPPRSQDNIDQLFLDLMHRDYKVSRKKYHLDELFMADDHPTWSHEYENYIHKGDPRTKYRTPPLDEMPVVLEEPNGEKYLLDGRHRAVWHWAYDQPFEALVLDGSQYPP